MVAEAVRHLAPGEGRRPYSADELAVIADVLDAAVDWQAGRLPLGEFWRTGTLLPRPWTHKSGGDGGTVRTCRGEDATGFSRFVALNWAVNAGDPRRLALVAAIEAAGQAGWIQAREAGT
jgi:hypothetical protein